MPDLMAEETEKLRTARREFLRAQLAQDQAALELRRTALEIAGAHGCEPEQLGNDGRIR